MRIATTIMAAGEENRQWSAKNGFWTTFKIYKSDINQVFKLFHDRLASLPHMPECQRRLWDIASFVTATLALTLSTYNTFKISKLETAIQT
jgi:hypothetical protein